MSDQDIPIDINAAKLLNWLISRQHVGKEWQASILKIREKINAAIQDMPEHTEIVQLLSGQHINYFHCLKIVEILKETEATSKNLFGQYGSKRMKDWQEIINCYQKDNVYLGEAAQLLARNVNYEVPILRKQIAKFEQAELECKKKLKDYAKNELTNLADYHTACKQLGIAGINIKSELRHLPAELPTIYTQIAQQARTLQPAIDLYSAFVNFESAPNDAGADGRILPLLNHVITHGNTTVYEYEYGRAPLKIEGDETATVVEVAKCAVEENAIDFGDEEIDFGVPTTNSDASVESNFSVIASDIDWTDDGFEIVEHGDVAVENAAQIVVEEAVHDAQEGVARGAHALTLLDNRATRDLFHNDLLELDAFLKVRLQEMENTAHVLIMSLIEDVTALVQVQTVESVSVMRAQVAAVLDAFTQKRVQQLHSIRHAPQYIDRLAADLEHRLTVVERMRAGKRAMAEEIAEGERKRVGIAQSIERMVDAMRVLQREMEGAIGARYNGRIVHITGGVNAL